MFGALWSLITGNRYVRALVGAVGAVLAVLAYGAAKKREGAQVARSEAERAALEAESRGHKGAKEAQDRIAGGETPAEIIRKNDGRWK